MLISTQLENLTTLLLIESAASRTIFENYSHFFFTHQKYLSVISYVIPKLFLFGFSPILKPFFNSYNKSIQ